ncbi:unnamed protein product [Chironomus riparius]|uniref:Uncharacterized protein n=1 Tax=Chironomus riparius TaxID=315576 RepID=A0A9N9S4T2_9DIPT|nr:unnamed protein product [Chironomus riparius]
MKNIVLSFLLILAVSSMTLSHKIIGTCYKDKNSLRNSQYFTLECSASNSINIYSRNENITSAEAYIAPNDIKELKKKLVSFDKVDGFKFVMNEIRYFPKGIERFFTNLVALTVEYSNLQEIKQVDLKPFPKLIFLNLSVNMLKIIEKDLFKFNPLLQAIDLTNNIIKEIDGNVFEGLNSLNSLKISMNLCVQVNAVGRKNVENFIKELKIFCKKKEQKFILDEKKGTKFNWRKYFWIILISGTSAVVFLIYGLFKILMTVKVAPKNEKLSVCDPQSQQELKNNVWI